LLVLTPVKPVSTWRAGVISTVYADRFNAEEIAYRVLMMVRIVAIVAVAATLPRRLQ
jgi:low temperature requirement protein LtrA